MPAYRDEDGTWHPDTEPDSATGWPKLKTPRPIKDRVATPNAFWQAVVILGIIAFILAICCGVGAFTAIRIWGH